MFVCPVIPACTTVVTDSMVPDLMALDECTVDVYDKHGKVWRLGRGPTEAEVRKRISSLPAVFSRVTVHYTADRLEAAREAGWFDIKVIEYREKD